jgi:hypothetical protein
MRQAVMKAGPWFERPMVSAEFAYSPMGAIAAIGLGSVIGAMLYALTLWPVDTFGWLAFAIAARFFGRGPMDHLFR